MGYIPDFIPLPNTNPVTEIVGDYAKVIAMVPDVRGKICSVTPADDSLFGLTRSFPVDFKLQLIGFDEPRWFGKVTELAKEEDEAVCPAVVIQELTTGLDGNSAVDGAFDQGNGLRVVPRLRSTGARHNRRHD